jgi:hypothetical protein
VLHQIGAGVLGPVFRTYEPSRDRLVAVKVFRLDVPPEQARALADELAGICGAGLVHPSIVTSIAAGVEGSLAYLAEEYVAAESLDVALRHYAPAPLDKALPFIEQLAGAIDFARTAGLGHGALHPRDVFVTPDEARATGFGVVDALERIGIRAPVRRPYSAPERIAGERWGTPADVFSLAAIAYELITGRRPAGAGDRLGTFDGVADECAEAIREVLSRALDENPGRRYQTALAFAAALDAATRGSAAQSALGRTAPPDARAEPVAVPAAVPVTVPEDEPAEAVEDALGAFAYEPDLDPTEADEPAVIAGPAFANDEPDELADFPTAGAVQRATAEPAAAEFLDFGEHNPAADVAFREPETAHHAPSAPAARVSDLPDPSARRRPAGSTGRPPRPVLAVVPSVLHLQDEGRPPLSYDVGRPRPMMSPFAVTLVIGLLVGFVAGYGLGSRERQAEVGPASTAARPDAPEVPPAAASGAKEWSDHPVDPGARGGQPASAASTPAPSTPPPAQPTPAPEASPPTAVSGRLTVRSTPSRAGVVVNGQWRGRTPLVLSDLAFGTYAVRVVEPGYGPETRQVVLSRGTASRELSVTLLRPKPAPTPQRGPEATVGRLFVESRPPGARVFVDDRLIGVTPLRLADVSPGAHTVRIELAGYRTVSSPVQILAGAEERLAVTLERTTDR